MNRVVVHYHEIALKRGNRKAFVQRLADNIAYALRGTGVRKVRSGPARIVVSLRQDADWPEIQRRLGRVYGAVGFAPGWHTSHDLDAIVATAVAAVQGRSARTFGVKCKRSDKRYPIPSMDVARRVGGAIQAATGWGVDLSHPDVWVTVEIVPRRTYVLLDPLPAPGGLPVGSSGNVLALLSGGIDSPVAAARLMRRGCNVDLIHFHGAPLQNRSSVEKVEELAAVLATYQRSQRLHLIAFGEIQRQIVAAVPRPFRVVLYRRMMLRIAEVVARRIGAGALVSGESLGQVASQTLENLTAIGAAATLPLLRPLIAMDKAEIMAEAERLGTFEISIRPDEDCCQLFVPRHPSTGMSLALADEVETPLDIEALVQQALAGLEVRDYGDSRHNRRAVGRSTVRAAGEPQAVPSAVPSAFVPPACM